MFPTPMSTKIQGRLYAASLRWALARVPMRDEEKARLEREAAEGKDFVPKLERVLVGLDGSDNGWFASWLAGWLVGARHLAATVMEVDGAAKNSGPTSTPSQGVIEAAETAAHALEAKDNPPKDDARDPIDAAVEGAKSERIPVRELISIIPLKAHGDTTDHACAEVILAEAKKGYGHRIEYLRSASGK